MGMDKDRQISLALAHARLHVAKDMLRWALNAESDKILPAKEIYAMIDKIGNYGDAVFQAIQKNRGG